MSFVADLRTVLRGRDFRRLYATRLISQFSDGVFQVGVAGFVLFSPERQTSAGKAAVAAALLLLPYSLLGPFVGVFIDRWRRRQILVYSPVIRAAGVTAVAGLLASYGDNLPFYLLALLVLGVNRFFLSALSAGLPHVVSRDELMMGNSISVTSGTIAAFVGAGVGSALRLVCGADRSGTALLLLLSAVVYVLASVAATTIDRDRLGPDLAAAVPETREALGSVIRGLVDGMRHIWHRRAAAAALGAIAAHRFLYGVITIMTVLLVANYFTRSAQAGFGGFALVLAVSGIGYFLAAIVTPPVTDRIAKQTWITAQLAFAAVAVVGFVGPFNEVLFVVGAFFLGLVSQGVKISVDTIVQETVLDAYRGRVFSVYDMLFNGLFVAGFAFAAATLPASGRSYAVLGVIVAGYALAAVGYGLAARVSAPSGQPRPSPR